MNSWFSRKSDPSEDASEEHIPQPEDSLNELRKLLVGPLHSQIEEMRELMRDQGINPDDLSKILPEAIMIRAARDRQMVKAVEPLTEEAIKASVERDPRVLVEVLVPVMLPAIRKAITTLIKEMIQTFSATLEHGLSMRGLKWRFEAFKTKKPFGEVALLHSLVYQVEQVFLIHKETGLVLQHAVSEDTVAQDPDMVSAMLTAIQDFVRDSFGAGQDATLENLHFGDRTVLIEQTSLAVLAAVVWGTPPVEVEKALHETLSAIHFEQLDNLRYFEGDTAPFEITGARISDCLRSQFKSKKRNPVLLWLLVGAAVFGIGYGSFFFIRDYMRWNDYLEKLHGEPGIVITETNKKNGKYHIFGLRDMLASDPVEMLRASDIEADRVIFDWELYHSSHPDFIIRRIRGILRPPETIELEVRDNVLHVRGSAPHHWIAEAEKLAKAIPGIMGFADDGVVDADIRNIEIIREEIEKTYFFFDRVSVEIKPGQEHILKQLDKDIREFDRLNRIFDKQISIEIVGHTDSVGTDERNLEISRKRAEKLFSLLVAGGMSADMFTTRGAGWKELLREEFSEADRELNRYVSFHIIRDSEEYKAEREPGWPAEQPKDNTGPQLPATGKKISDSAEFGPL